MDNKLIRVRIAPSPTGYFHIGTARTALFNYLFAKHTGGKFILRIEDTDLERSEKRFEQNIFESMHWLGLIPDESPEIGGEYGPYRQTERLDIYEKYIQKLLDQDSAYYCFCTKEELEIERIAQQKSGQAPKYNGKCRARNAKSGGEVIRFRIPEEKVSFTDLIRHKVEFDGSLIGDIAIAKNERAPLYNFAVVVDDYEMKISHVIRGEDHIGNTPKQIFIQKALGFTEPIYAHLPLILDTSRAKISKRYSAVSMDDYHRDGFLPEALLNFMALLGWHPQDDKEILTIDEIIKNFSLERVQKSGAIFDIEKLKWMNSQYIKKINNAELIDKVFETYSETKNQFSGFNSSQLSKIAALAKERMETLKDFSENVAVFLATGDYAADLLVWKQTPKDTIKSNLIEIKSTLENYSDEFIKYELEKIIAPIANVRGKGETFWPLRVALSGRDKSPGPLEIIEVLGKNETLVRITAAISKL